MTWTVVLVQSGPFITHRCSMQCYVIFGPAFITTPGCTKICVQINQPVWSLQFHYLGSIRCSDPFGLEFVHLTACTMSSACVSMDLKYWQQTFNQRAEYKNFLKQRKITEIANLTWKVICVLNKDTVWNAVDSRYSAIIYTTDMRTE